MTIYYVNASTGDDTNAGTELAPWSTIERAKAYHTPPTQYHRLTISKGNATLFTSGEELRNTDTDRAWFINFVDGMMLIERATGNWHIDPVTVTGQDSGATADTWTATDDVLFDPLVTAGDTVLFKDGNYGVFEENTNNNPSDRYYNERNNWVTYKADTGEDAVEFDSVIIRNSDGGSPGRSYLWFENIKIPAGNLSFFITHYIKIINCEISAPTVSFVDAFWEWYVAANHKLITGENVADMTIQGCVVTKGYRGIHNDSDCKNWLIEDCEYSEIVEIGNMSGASDITIQDSNFHTLGGDSAGAGAWTLDASGGVAGILEVGEVLMQATTGATGVYVSTSSGRFIYQYQTSETDWENGYIVTGQDSGATFTVTSATSGLIHPDAAYFDTGDNTTFTRNIITTGAQSVSYYRYSEPGMANVIFTNNLINSSRPSGECVTFEGWGSGIVANNTILTGGATVKLQILHNSSSVITNMYNNIFPELVQSDDSGAFYTRIINHGNNIFTTDPDGIGDSYPFTVDTNTELTNEDVTTDYFTDYDNDDFTLAEDSFALNFGNTTYAPATDIIGVIRGVPPDAGAYDDGMPIPPDPTPDPTPTVTNVSNNLFLTSPTTSATGSFVNNDGTISNYSDTSIQKEIIQDGNNFTNKSILTFSGTTTITLTTSYPLRTYSTRTTSVKNKVFVGKPVFGADTTNKAEIRYTVNGKKPSLSSKIYKKPLVFKQNTSGIDDVVLKYAIYYKGKKSAITTINLRIIKRKKRDIYEFDELQN